MTYDVDFISEYWCACVETLRAYPVLVIYSRISECVMKFGGYNVDSMLSSNPKEFELVGAEWVGEVWGWLIHAAFVFVMEMPGYVYSHSPWWVIACKLEMFPPVVRALGLETFLICLLFVRGFGHIHILRHKGSRVTAMFTWHTAVCVRVSNVFKGTICSRGCHSCQRKC